MKSRYLFFALAGVIASVGNGGVVINEFSYDDAGGDSSEFIELYNNGASPVDINGWKVTRGSTANTASYAPSTSTIIPAGGFFLLGSAGGTGSTGIANIENATYPSNLGNSEQFIAIYDASNAVVDSVTYARGAGAAILSGIGEPPSTGTAGTGGGIWAYHVTWDTDLPNAGIRWSGDPNATLTLQRNPNPTWNDTDDNERDFLMGVATPRGANFSSGTVTLANVNAGITYDFDDNVSGTAVTSLPGNYSSITRRDPTSSTIVVLGNQTSPNPSVIPPAPSPGGGNAGMFWGLTTTANSGFGDAAILNLSEAVTDVEAESLVYIPPVVTAGQEAGNFFILRGRPDVFYQYEGAPGPFDNGDVGIRLHYENNVTPGQVNLSIDQKVDGTTTTLSGPIPITTPGWYRVLLSAKGSNVAAIIGGAFGTQTPNGSITGQGQRFPAAANTYYTTTLTRPGGVGMNVHHLQSAATTAAAVTSAGYRPLTYDHMVFRAPTLIVSVAKADNWELFE